MDYTQKYVEYSRLFGYAFSIAQESDFFSKNGVSWDETADWLKDSKYVYTSENFQQLMFSEMRAIMNSAPMPDRSEFSEEFQKFLARVESREAE